MSAPPPAMTIAVINDPSSGISVDVFRRAVVALAIMLERDVAPAYGLTPPILTMRASAQDAPRGAALCKVVGAITDDPSAQGYHTVDDDGTIDAYVSTEGVDEAGFTECLGHELAELLVDPEVNETRIAATGDRYPLEVCDAVQGQRYPIDLGDGKPPVQAPNFVLPGYWDAAATCELCTPFDKMGLLPGPFTLAPEGYSAITRADGTRVQIGAASKRKPHELSRAGRRVRLAECAFVSPTIGLKPAPVPVRFACTGSGFNVTRCAPDEAAAFVEAGPNLDKQLAQRLGLWPVVVSMVEGVLRHTCTNCGGRNEPGAGGSWLVVHLHHCTTPEAQA